MESKFECAKCESQGTCDESLVFPKPNNCMIHRFIRDEPTMGERRAIKSNWHCYHCGLQMSLQLTGPFAGIIQFGHMA